MKAFILTYHSGNVTGNNYASNNLLALADDLAYLLAARIPIVPLRDVVDSLLHSTKRLLDKMAVITLDDGLDFDFVELAHPIHGPQPSARAILSHFSTTHDLPVQATSFVIASPSARYQIAEHEMRGHQWIGEQWWNAAVASGLFHVGNHSWDHLSPSVSPIGQRDGKAGAFTHVDSYEDAELQVRIAREYIHARAPNPGTALFAYPYGNASTYLVEDYLPTHVRRHGTIGAVTTTPGVVHDRSNRWLLPRFTCGIDWRSPEELGLILAA